MKKILMLCFTLIAAILLTFSVSAYTDVEAGTYQSDAIIALSDFDILHGYEDGSFKPEQNITRAEMTKILCETLDYEQLKLDIMPFDDVESTHWAAGYINTAYGVGMIDGYGNRKFGPEDTVTFEQAVKMTVSALGYSSEAIKRGGWPTGYITTAANIGILKEVNGATRGDIATLIYNAIHTPLMEMGEVKDGFGLFKEYKTILTERDIYILTGIVEDTTFEDEVVLTSEEDIPVYIGDTNIKDYIYRQVEVYASKDKDEYTAISIKSTKDNKTFTLISDDIKEIENNKIYYIDELTNKTKYLTINEDVVVEYNKDIVTYSEAIDKVLSNNNISITFIENNGKTGYDVIVMKEYELKVIDTIDLRKEKIVFSFGSFVYDEEANHNFYDADGNVIELTDFEPEDVVFYLADSDKYYVEIVKADNREIFGTIEKVRSTKKSIIIDGEEYKVSETIWEKVNTPGLEGHFYFGVNDEIIYYNGTTVVGDYGYILSAKVEKQIFVVENEDVVVEEQNIVTVKILTKSGIDSYTLTENASKLFVNEFGKENIGWFGADKVSAKRFVEYKINRNDEISYLDWKNELITDNFKYNANTEIFGKDYVDKNTQIFVINDEKIDNLYVSNMKYLTHDSIYNGAVYSEDGEAKVIFILASEEKYNNELGLGIVINSGFTLIDDELIYTIDYVQGEEEGTIYFEDTSAEEDFAIGTIFIFNTNGNDYVSNYEIIANIADNKFEKVEEINIGEDVEIVFGTIDNTIRKTNTKGELITIGTETYVITSKTNKYTFVPEDNSIETGDFTYENAYYGNGTEVMINLVDGVVVDIYTISPIEE